VLWLQKTVAAPASISGVGLHTGEHTRLTLAPAAVNTGLVFRLTSDGRQVEIPAVVENVCVEADIRRRTTLERDGVSVTTVEHVLSALHGSGVTNCYIDLEGSEPPVVGAGNALPYLELIDQAGVHDQGLPANYYKAERRIRWREDNIDLSIEPASEFIVTFGIDYEDPLIGVQEATFTIRPDVYREEIAPARTFVLREDIEMLRARGLAQGGSLETALVVDGGRLMDGQSLRWPDEFVRHKILDLIGDLALLGMPIQGHVRATRAGHVSNVAFTRLLAAAERKMVRIYPTREPKFWDIASIMAIMPHRYPMLLVDRILELEPGKRVVGIKNVSINEPFFQGHFPGHPIMPAVLIIEAMAQTGGVLLLNSVEDPRGKLVYFSGIDGARFRQPVKPGDQLRFELELVKVRGPICKMRGVAYVDDEKVAEADLMSNIVDA